MSYPGNFEAIECKDRDWHMEGKASQMHGIWEKKLKWVQYVCIIFFKNFAFFRNMKIDYV